MHAEQRFWGFLMNDSHLARVFNIDVPSKINRLYTYTNIFLFIAKQLSRPNARTPKMTAALINRYQKTISLFFPSSSLGEKKKLIYHFDYGFFSCYLNLIMQWARTFVYADRLYKSQIYTYAHTHTRVDRWNCWLRDFIWMAKNFGWNFSKVRLYQERARKLHGAFDNKQ